MLPVRMYSWCGSGGGPLVSVGGSGGWLLVVGWMVDVVAVSGSGGGGPLWPLVDGGVDGGCGVVDVVAVRWWAMRPCVVSRIY